MLRVVFHLGVSVADASTAPTSEPAAAVDVSLIQSMDLVVIQVFFEDHAIIWQLNITPFVLEYNFI
jgi:hypothetical protein